MAPKKNSKNVPLDIKALKEIEESYRGLFNAVTEAIYIQDIDGKFLDVNDGAVKMYGYPRDYFIGKTPEFLSAPGLNNLEQIFGHVQKTFSGKPQQFEFWGKRFNGEIFPKKVSLTRGRYLNKDVVVAIASDITESKRAELLREALFEISEAAYTASDMYALYKKIHQVIASLMQVKNIYIALYDEKNVQLSFPYWVDEYDPPLPPKKLGRGLTEYVLRTGQAVLVDFQKDTELRKSGEIELIGSQSPVWLGVPLKIGGKTIGVIVVQDYENEKAYGEAEMQILTFVSEQIAQVIERKRSADDIKIYSDELKQLNQTKDKFFSIIAHDLKNPFITILGFSDLLLSDYSDLSDEERLFYIQEMKKSAEMSHHLLQNLLHWSRSQTGRIEFNPQKIELKKIVDDNLVFLSKTAEKKQIQLFHEIASDLFVTADEDMLNTVMRNLLTNAIKFSHKGGSINVHAIRQGTSVQIGVQDTGVGMDQNTIDNLFRLDLTRSKTGTENESGSGLGLILCKEFVERNNGKIWIESIPGKGSKFIFTLPLL
ncbi:MAG: ATP-binding protein [Ignavibacteriales bacterium]|nr:ATP-binding protein [Ignavibacteriales bacterium]